MKHMAKIAIIAPLEARDTSGGVRCGGLHSLRCLHTAMQ
jgi:hypothetical protein